MCKKCTPSASPVVLCKDPSQITEVNCDNETAPAPNVTFDACTSGEVVASIGTTYVYECTVKVSLKKKSSTFVKRAPLTVNLSREDNIGWKIINKFQEHFFKMDTRSSILIRVHI